ncbi:molybdenum cofactor biosynthesis protein MoaE [Erythrobacter sp.]|uniref:molybdenum cofactor biosynthesis protein MoaE n=1 Tax=Erythrobacter sp. TaxID=1042 RepID=UPI001425CCDE|nr:molybdenum cofactor biosynthesis protein MoaE [Erythrobacter sp.]QIQ86656.1 MAG: molybdenum cofactor biosynthesis protein MoaE [Erythrobacter sp.]
MREVRLDAAPFDPGAAVDALATACPDAGGIASFIGKVRAGGGVEALELTHYEPLTLPGMEALAERAFDRFDLMGLAMVHRVGVMHPGEPIVCVAAAARHRRDAIQAVDFCMDHLKSAAWFWKREKRAGEWQWIEPRPEDHADLARW